MGDGDQSGLWGQTTNTNLGTLVEQAVTGVVSITMSDANYTLTSFNGVADEARNAVLVVTGTNAAVRDLIPPVQEKLYTIVNNTTGGFAIRVIGTSGTGVNIPNGTTCFVYCDGTNFVNGLSGTSGNFTINGTGTVANLIATSNVTAINVTASANISSANATFSGTVTVPTVANTSNTTIAASTAFVNAAVTTVSASLGTIASQNANNVTITGGTITGITDLTVADGGTGASTFTANSVVLGNGTSSLAGNMIAPGTSGNVLTSNGTTWASSTPPSAIGVGQSYTDFVSAGGRATGTVYQNTTGKAIMVNIAGVGSTGIAFCDTNNPPTTQCAYAPAGGGAVFASMSFIVPNNFYYLVTGGLSYYCWSELR
jgi:hypothetical protein